MFGVLVSHERTLKLDLGDLGVARVCIKRAEYRFNFSVAQPLYRCMEVSAGNGSALGPTTHFGKVD